MNEGHHRTPLPAADLESLAGNATFRAYVASPFNSPVNIHVISYRSHKHDPDGVSVKAVLDGLVALGILTDDSSEQVKKVSFESRKAKDEKTIIEITSVTGEENDQ